MDLFFKETVGSNSGSWATSGDPAQGAETSAEIDITKITEEDDVEEVSNSSIQKPKRYKGIDSKRGSVGLRLCDQFDRIIEILNGENTVAASVPTIGTCLKILKQLPGLEYGSETHLLGIRLMKSKSNRETFVLLGDPILQLKWIKTHTLADLSRR